MKRALPWIALIVVAALCIFSLRRGRGRDQRPARRSSKAECVSGQVAGSRGRRGSGPEGAKSVGGEEDDYASARRDPRLISALALFDEQRYEHASSALSRLVATSARADVRELAAFFLAQVSFTKGDYLEARTAYRRFLTDHPGSPFTDNARAAIAFVDRFGAKGVRP